jgi:hypothetical protein
MKCLVVVQVYECFRKFSYLRQLEKEARFMAPYQRHYEVYMDFLTEIHASNNKS